MTYQAVQNERQRLQLTAGGGIDFFSQNTQVIGPPELFFEQSGSLPGTSSLSNATSRQWNWNLNAIHTYTPGALKLTTSAGVQVEDRELDRSRLTALGLLPGQSNIDQGSAVTPFEFKAKERTLAFYGQEEGLALQERQAA